MENKVSVIASTSGTDSHSVDAVDKYSRNKAVFNSVIEGETKLYKKIYLFGDSVLETHSVIRKFIRDNRFWVETISPWMLESREFDVEELFTKEEL